MAVEQVEIDVDATPEAVWDLVGDFGGIDSWMAGVESCRLQGDDRIIVTMGIEITERLISKNDSERTLVYSITEGAPVETHQGTITVVPHGEGSHVTWEVDVTPDEMAPFLAGVYQQALESLKQAAES